MSKSVQNQYFILGSGSDHIPGRNYRPDIDGLRGIAVLAVVGYHAFPSWMASGFIGVDVFFVISGFLISSIIFGHLQENRFSFVQFYERRIKRIFPALFLVLGATFAIGWFFLLPNEYRQLGKHIAAAAGFTSNFVLWSESGYFDSAAETKPLLHLWSLGIEEQFYLLWPLVLWLSWKRRINPLVICLLVIGSSFAINVKTVNSDVVAAFYSPLSRFWEIILGALLAYFALNKPPRSRAARNGAIGILSDVVYGSAAEEGGSIRREVVAILGLSLIALAIFVISGGSNFPGYWALLPAAGTYLILSAGPHAWLNREVLSNRWLVGIGLISYPLYLWHWPLLTFARIAEKEALTPGVRVAAVLLSFVLAGLTYRWLEKPIRFGCHGKTVPLLLVVLLIGIGCAGFYSVARDGFPLRFGDKASFEMFFRNTPPEFKYAANHHLFEAYREQCNFYDNRNVTKRVRDHIDEACYTPKTAHSLFIWGDSHAEHLYYGLSRTLPKSISILQVTTSACFPSLEDQFPDSLSTCNKSNRFALRTIAEVKPQTVLLAQAGAHTASDFDKIAIHLKALGVRHVLLVGPVPQWNLALPKVIVNDFWPATPTRSFHALKQEVFETDKVLKEKYVDSKNLTYISLTDFFCNSSGCLLYIGNDRREDIVTFDYGHLLPKASEFLSRDLLAPIIIQTFPELSGDGSSTQLAARVPVQ
jgi:peptidoglycan/LPS O-acetylase OafA/YrhL